MKSLAFYFGLSLGLISLNSSCTTGAISSTEKLPVQDSSELSSEVKPDEIKPIKKKEIKKESSFLDDFKSVFSDDSLLLDSNFIETIENYPFLSSENVRSFESVLLDKKLSENNHIFLNQYFMLDSIKRNHQYSKYLSKITIGQVKECVANALYQINLEDKGVLLIWSLTHSSYEADPFTYGTEIYATIYVADSAQQTTLIAEALYSMDPPAFYSEIIYTRYQNKVFSLKKHIESGELKDDDSIVYDKNTSASYKIKIAENVFSIKQIK